MLAFGMTSGSLWTLHFFLLHALTGAAMNFIGASRAYTYYKIKPVKSNLWVLWSFTAISVSATALTWQGIISLLPFIGSMTGVIGYWQPTAKSIRRISLISPPSWFTYNFISHSYAGMATEILIMTSILTGIHRLDRKPKKRKLQKYAV